MGRCVGQKCPQKSDSIRGWPLRVKKCFTYSKKSQIFTLTKNCYKKIKEFKQKKGWIYSPEKWVNCMHKPLISFIADAGSVADYF